MNEVILVDENDRAIGQQEKLSAHETGELHRAFSIFLFDAEGRWLLQQRNPDKYHSGGLWTNTCCSHPAPGEKTSDAAQVRLVEEMGIATPIEPAFEFLYRAHFDNGLIEHELDHVFIGQYDGPPTPNPLEVVDWRWVELDVLRNELAETPEKFTVWFRKAVDRVRDYREQALVH